MSDMEKAFRWVCNNWHQEDREGIAGVWGALTQFAGAGGGVLALGTDASMIKTIHQMIMSQPYPVAFRNVNPIASYPSSMGGNVLMKKIFEGTAGVVFPPPGDDLWYDWALFYMAALVTVQGFVDANKRTGRMAYAVVLVKGGVPFAAFCSDPCDGRTQGTTGMFDSLPYRNDAAIVLRRLIRSLRATANFLTATAHSGASCVRYAGCRCNTHPSDPKNASSFSARRKLANPRSRRSSQPCAPAGWAPG